MEHRIGLRLKQIRNEKGIKQSFVSKKLGFKHSSSLSDIESGRRGIAAEKIPILAEILGVEIEELFFEKKIRDSRTNNTA
ncbi:helix-turn-helix domain-containing protein [Halalkalibacter krulwichiae]|uniref:Helix-turn-helix domain protein n=1 Tax=Halalkalibacter krulwichiae TaxID=199441 RepID=A0A1X9MKJ7_9BACI|nr:helix-turn-helix transcriptional regulator [Halalkalibacter krulwichiae]ARK32181.1 Helix-turn-helix domain protein [Halalkalibacter krulwichiae]